MSLSYQFLKIYFQIQILLSLTWFFFRILRTLNKSRPGSSLLLLRLAQIAIIASVITPIGVHLIPIHRIPTIEFSTAKMLLEPQSTLQTQKKRQEATLQETSVKDPTAFNQLNRKWIQFSAFKTFRNEFILFFIGLGIFVSSLRFRKKYSELKSLISESLFIRNLGNVSIAISEKVRVPFSTWMNWKAYVILPTELVPSRSDFKTAIQHELQHHRHKDTIWAVFIEYLICIFFFNPFIYLWKKDLIEFQEFSCDEALIGRKMISSYEYGICLVRVAEAAMESKALLVGTTGMASHSKNPDYCKSFLQRRIEMFDIYQLNSGRSVSQMRLGVALGTAMLFVTLTISYATELTLRPNSPILPNPGEATYEPKIQSITERILKSSLEKKRCFSRICNRCRPEYWKNIVCSQSDS